MQQKRVVGRVSRHRDRMLVVMAIATALALMTTFLTVPEHKAFADDANSVSFNVNVPAGTTFDFATGTFALDGGSVSLSAPPADATKSDNGWRLTYADTTTSVTFTFSASTGYEGNMEVEGVSVSLEGGAYTMTDLSQTVDLSFSALHELTIAGATSVSNGTFAFPGGSLSISYGSVTYAGNSEHVWVPETDSHVTLTFVASQKDYVPSVTGIPAGDGQAPSFWQDSNDATGKTWTCNFDVSADLTITISVSKSPAIGIVSGSSGITTAANGSTLEFWNPSFSGSVAFATLTASDGQNSVDLYPSANGALPYFSYPINKHLECTLVVPAGYVPTVMMGSSSVELHGVQGNPDAYAFNLDNLTGDATLSISFASAPKVTATGSTPTAAGNAITFSNGATLTATANGTALTPVADTEPYFTITDANARIELSLTMPSDATPIVMIGGIEVDLRHDQANPRAYTLSLGTVAADTTLSFSFADGYKLTLPAAYDAAYQAGYGTVQWSTSNGENATWNDITTGTLATIQQTMDFENNTPVTLYNYTFTSDQAIYIRATWPAGNPRGFTAMETNGATEGGNLSNGEAKPLIGSGSLQYDDWFTINWAYDAAYSLGPDDLVTNGKIIITNVTGGVDPTKNAIANDGSGMEGLAFLSSGATVTIMFVPDAGYQFTGVKANGTPIEGVDASNDRYTYTFTAEGMIHFSSSFEKFDDIVSSSAARVEAASLENGAAAVGSGNAQLNVTDGTVDNGILVSLRNAAGDEATIQSVLSLTLSQVITKGAAIEASNITDKTAWITQKTELDEPVTVSIVLDEGVVPDGSVVSVVRRHTAADGTVSTTLIEATYDVATRTLTFSSRLFSEFAIATKPGTSIVPTSPTSPSTDAAASVTASTVDLSANTASTPATGDATASVSSWAIIVGAVLVGVGLCTRTRVCPRRR